MSELDRRIRDQYARRADIPYSRYSPLNPEVLERSQERQRALVDYFLEAGSGSIDQFRILEIGCGGGSNLLELIALGADPALLTGIDLLADRIEMAARRLPRGVELIVGNALELNLADETFDVVYQSTVFSSILDNYSQVLIADRMWRLLKPGGAILWYDIAFDNPINPDVRGIPLHRILHLFPHGKVFSRRMTLAPPIGRRAVVLCRGLYRALASVPFLRSHLLCWIEKPR